MSDVVSTTVEGWYPDERDFDGSHVLAKASVDNFYEYAIGLRSGLVVACQGIQRYGDWIELQGIRKIETPSGLRPLDGSFQFGRGMEVRLADIVWLADGGH